MDSVHFDRVHDIYISQASWLVSFIIDLSDFDGFVHAVRKEMEDLKWTVRVFTQKYTELTRDAKTKIKGPEEKDDLVQPELNTNDKTLIQVKNSQDIIAKAKTHSAVKQFERLMGLTAKQVARMDKAYTETERLYDHLFSPLFSSDPEQSRKGRSILPFIGDALSAITGTATSRDIKKIEHHMEYMEETQKRQAHIMKESLSLINITYDAVQSNRVKINQMLNTTVALDKKIEGVQQEISRILGPLQRFVVVAHEINVLRTQLGQNVQMVRYVLDDFIKKVKSLAVGRISPDIILPSNLRTALATISSEIPVYLTLPKDYINDLFEYYKFMTCKTVLDKDRKSFYVLAKINLLDVRAATISLKCFPFLLYIRTPT